MALKRPRRVLYFSRDYTPHDHRFLAALAQTDLQVVYLRLERGPSQSEDRPLPPGVECVSWRGGQRPASRWDGPALLADLRRVLRQVQPDLVQAGPLQRCAFLVALAGFRPLVSTSWGYDLIADARRGVDWQWVTRFTLQRSAVMVGDSQVVRRLAHSFGMPDERIVTFPWGVDLQHFTPAPEGGNCASGRIQTCDCPFTLLSTRNWEPIYGVEIIARAFVQVVQAARNVPNLPKLRLVMLGQGSQAAMLRQILQPVAEQVTFPGVVGYADLPRYYRMADLYLSASHSDGASISLLEALACGLPALISDIPGNQEWVTPGVNGWLFRDGAADELAQAILRAAQDRPQLAELSQAARRTAEQRADWSANFQQLLSAYQLAMDIHGTN